MLFLFASFDIFRDTLWNPGDLVTLGGIPVSSQRDMTKRKQGPLEIPHRYHEGELDVNTLTAQLRKLRIMEDFIQPNALVCCSVLDIIDQPNIIKLTTPLICSYAELPKEVKNTISHRYRALAAMSEHFSQTDETSPESKKKKQED